MVAGYKLNEFAWLHTEWRVQRRQLNSPKSDFWSFVELFI